PGPDAAIRGQSAVESVAVAQAAAAVVAPAQTARPGIQADRPRPVFSVAPAVATAGNALPDTDRLNE
ncbi:MAG: hypothetical protein M3177_07405, partial [Pseudomonadota bacterium]|nr:hypothetical protein [Pseudomonadota bacterium]